MSAALVTGATAGIGLAFAEALAARGHDLVVVSRRTRELTKLAERLGSDCAVECESLPADLVERADVARVAARLRSADRPVDVLVNSAGVGTFGPFGELDLEGELAEIALNVVALVELSHAAFAPMVARRSGAIVNVSSVAGSVPTPNSATYGATKAYVASFSQALHEEARGTGVRVMALCPGYTRTEFHDRAGLGPTRIPAFAWQTADEVVTVALRDLDRGRAVSVPGALNKIAGALAGISPPAIARRVAGIVIRRT